MLFYDMHNRMREYVLGIPLVGAAARSMHSNIFGAGGLFDYYRFLKYGIIGGGWVEKSVSDESFLLRCASITETRRAVVALENEKSTLKNILSFCSQGSVVFDVGANTGTHTLPIAKRAGREGTVVCFEPHPKTYQSLNKNIRQNGLDNVMTEQLALGSSAGRSNLFIQKDAAGVGSHSLLREKNDIARSTEEVLVKTGDEYVSESKLKPDIIKIDVEGAELDVLKGFEETLAGYQPVLFVEVHDTIDSDEVETLLLNYGYHIEKSNDRKEFLIAEPEKS